MGHTPSASWPCGAAQNTSDCVTSKKESRRIPVRLEDAREVSGKKIERQEDGTASCGAVQVPAETDA